MGLNLDLRVLRLWLLFRLLEITVGLGLPVPLPTPRVEAGVARARLVPRLLLVLVGPVAQA
jgi:hypothetical protein